MTRPTTCVAICTHDRPRQLRALLDGLVAQTYIPAFPVIVVDSGKLPASEVVKDYADRLPITFEELPGGGLAAVRNRALKLALDQGCGFLAFIDDDEVPVPGWLAALMRRQAEIDADLVFGPVLATYHGTPPGWVTAGGFFERWGETPGSGNALIRLRLLPDDPALWFREAFALTGGEDADFFDRLIETGARNAIASDAIAFEDTPPDRASVRFIWRRGLRDGVVTAKRIAHHDAPAWRKALRGARACAAKLGYALTHFFQAIFAGWHAVQGIADLGSALAIALYPLGVRWRFYG